MRNDGTMYKGFYDRQLVVTVTSEPGSPTSTVPEDKRIIPDDNVLNYEIFPGMSDRIIRVSVSKLHSLLKLPFLSSFNHSIPRFLSAVVIFVTTLVVPAALNRFLLSSHSFWVLSQYRSHRSTSKMWSIAGDGVT